MVTFDANGIPAAVDDVPLKPEEVLQVGRAVREGTDRHFDAVELLASREVRYRSEFIDASRRSEDLLAALRCTADRDASSIIGLEVTDDVDAAAKAYAECLELMKSRSITHATIAAHRAERYAAEDVAHGLLRPYDEPRRRTAAEKAADDIAGFMSAFEPIVQQFKESFDDSNDHETLAHCLDALATVRSMPMPDHAPERTASILDLRRLDEYLQSKVQGIVDAYTVAAAAPAGEAVSAVHPPKMPTSDL